MTTFMNNLNEKLFTELAPTEAAIIQGGGTEIYRGGVTEYINLPRIDAGADLKLSTFTDTSNNDGFIAELQNKNTGEKYKKYISTGNETTYWRDLKGGTTSYVIDFRDDKKDVRGTRGSNSFVLSYGDY